MAEDSGQEKTEEPTPKKVDDAKKKGQIEERPLHNSSFAF